MRAASSSVVPSGAVTRPLLVMTADTGRVVSSTKRRSRLVRMPTSRRPRVIGTPEMRKRFIIAMASWIGRSGPSVIGSVIMPDSLRLTASTCSACNAAGMFLWTTPSPPFRAMAMAMSVSVTVSIAAERNGTGRAMSRATRVEVSTSRGSTSE